MHLYLNILLLNRFVILEFVIISFEFLARSTCFDAEHEVRKSIPLKPAHSSSRFRTGHSTIKSDRRTGTLHP